MHQVFQEIIQTATAQVREALSQELQEWDPDAWEQAVRQFTQQLGQQCLQTWAEVKKEQAQAQARLCPCGQRRQVHQRQSLWWLSTFGRVEIEVPYLRCPQGHGGDWPFQRLTGLACRSKSLALQRVLTDFGAEKSFGQASQQLWEHYGVALAPSSIREVVVRQARRAEGVVQVQHQGAVAAYQNQRGQRQGEPWLIAESDGSMVRTGYLEPAPEGDLSPKRRCPKRHRQTQWREVRLSTMQAPEQERRYGAVLGPPQKVGQQLLALALVAGYGEGTWVHGVGDGAPWIAQQMAEVFPRQRYLLDRYHLLEHLYGAANAFLGDHGESAKGWVARQVARIDQGSVAEVIEGCRAEALDREEHPLQQLASYLEHQRDHLDYAAAKAQGLPIGSGAVEGGHRHVIQARLKLPGAWWKEETVNPMLALRTLRANGGWETFWN